ncbi:cytochrome P450 [Catenulispora sp. EB89]|uniref:cytochrome P450 n=1 Tax=Catenulispora sp. EB89 TaxID=3156257 RepID=UPI003514C224
MSVLDGGGDPAAGRMLVVTDPPRHTDLRGILARHFSPRALRSLEPAIAGTVDMLLDDVIGRGECDFVSQVAEKLPVKVICELLGVPQQDQDWMIERTTTAFAGGSATEPLQARIAYGEIMLYYSRLARDRRSEPREDLISVLAAARIEGRELTAAELALNCVNLVIGGNETTRYAAASAVLAFALHPEQFRLVQDGTASVSEAVDEVLRWATPAQHVMRTVRDETLLGDSCLRPGDAVTVWLAAANRDPEVFPDPARFDVTRSAKRNLTFGTGVHTCLGIHLALLELRILIARLAHRVDRIALAGSGRWLESNFLSGLTGLPVVLEPRVA